MSIEDAVRTLHAIVDFDVPTDKCAAFVTSLRDLILAEVRREMAAAKVSPWDESIGKRQAADQPSEPKKEPCGTCSGYRVICDDSASGHGTAGCRLSADACGGYNRRPCPDCSPPAEPKRTPCSWCGGERWICDSDMPRLGVALGRYGCQKPDCRHNRRPCTECSAGVSFYTAEALSAAEARGYERGKAETDHRWRDSYVVKEAEARGERRGIAVTLRRCARVVFDMYGPSTHASGWVREADRRLESEGEEKKT